jgi:hypothetical protein
VDPRVEEIVSPASSWRWEYLMMNPEAQMEDDLTRMWASLSLSEVEESKLVIQN